MADIKRYEGNIDHLFEHEQGDWVKHSDHEAALAAAVVAERDRCVDIINAYATVCDRSPEMLMDIARGAAHE